jgi:hypothetical protein
LFGDGAAATVIAGSEIGGRQGGGARRVIATRSVFYPTERTMGWSVVDSGFKIVLSPAIPKLVREHIGSGTLLTVRAASDRYTEEVTARCRVSEHSSTDTTRAIRTPATPPRMARPDRAAPPLPGHRSRRCSKARLAKS